MLRVTRLALYAVALLSLWAVLLSSNLSVTTRQLVLWVSARAGPLAAPLAAAALADGQPFSPAQSPVLAVLAFGAFLLASLIYGVATFKTVPEEAESLQLDIARAKRELARRGITA
jgi:hypothetical protein